MTAGVRPPGYRLPDATRLGGVSLLVTDLGRSIAYYEEILGLRVLERRERVATLAAGEAATPLLTLRSEPGMAHHGVARLGLFHFALLVPSRAALGQFLAHLVAQRVAAGSADHAVSEALYLQDPDNLGIEVYWDRPRSTWQQRGDELYIVSEPLDLESVLAAGGPSRFEGLPSGTVLGHMHLRVGAIDQAEAFYHQALGFDKTAWTYPGALFLAAGGYHHHLGTNTWGGRLSPRAAREPGLTAWEIVLPGAAEIGAAVRSCVHAGAQASERDDGWAVIDPWGTELRLVSRGN
jgi:catechol 2,3-dioxygenase